MLGIYDDKLTYHIISYHTLELAFDTHRITWLIHIHIYRMARRGSGAGRHIYKTGERWRLKTHVDDDR